MIEQCINMSFQFVIVTRMHFSLKFIPKQEFNPQQIIDMTYIV